MKKIITAAVMLTVLLSVSITAQTDPAIDLEGFLKLLEGTWTGQGDGMSGDSSTTQEYQFILKGKFLRMTTISIFKPQEKNPKGEVHEDLGIFSLNSARKTIMLRSFYVEGFVNTYYLDNPSADGTTFTFLTESVENAPSGTKAMLVFKFISDIKLEQSFHVAFPGQELSCYSTNVLVKKK